MNGACGKGIDVRLVEPASAQLHTVRDHTFLAQRGRGSDGQPLAGDALADDQFDAEFFTELFLFQRVAVRIDKKDIWFQLLDFLFEIHDAASGIDPGFFHIADGADHVKAFLLIVDRSPAFQLVNGLVGSDSDIKLPVGRSFFEKCHMPAVKHIITA